MTAMRTPPAPRLLPAGQWPTGDARYQPVARPPARPGARPGAQGRHGPLGGRALRRAFAAYYLGTVLVAAAGQVSAAAHWSDWHPVAAAPVVVVLEAGGVVIAARADERRRLGERAYAALALSALVAAGATAVNVVGHLAMGQSIAAFVFGGLTALGYTIWLVDCGYARRDALRRAGQLAETRPAYGPWQWLRHPRMTRLALDLWLRARDQGTPLTVGESLAQAQVAAVMHREIRRGGGAGGYADVALALYDLSRVAVTAGRLVDHEALAARIAAHVSVDEVAGSLARAGGRRWWWWLPLPGRRADRPVGRPSNRAGDLATDRPSNRAGDRATDRPSNRAGDLASDRASGRPGDRAATDQASDRASGRPGDRATGRAATKATVTAMPGGRPTIDELVAELATAHPGERLSRDRAAATLRAKFGACSDARARQARDRHNNQLEEAR